MMSLSRVELLRIIVAGVFRILLVGEKFGQRPRFAHLPHWHCIGIDETQRLRQPARAIEKPLGLLGHVGLLQMVDQLSRRLTLGLAHGLQNARLGDPAEIVVDGRSPASPHHVKLHRARQRISLVETRANAVGRDAALIVAVGRLIDGVDRKRRTVGEQRRLCTTIESRQRIPEIVLALRQPCQKHYPRPR